jgi:hypothetical protein
MLKVLARQSRIDRLTDQSAARERRNMESHGIHAVNLNDPMAARAETDRVMSPVPTISI